MQTVTLSSKFQIVIPRSIREQLQLMPGKKFRVIGYADRVELIPVRRVEMMRGFLRGLDTKIECGDDGL